MFPFLSTPSVRRATQTPDALDLALCYFYPRPPYGGRLRTARRRVRVMLISIHALRTEGDTRSRAGVSSALYFYPRPPYGGRPAFCGISHNCTRISIHALRTEGDTSVAGCDRHSQLISIHALRTEGDPPCACFPWVDFPFLSTPSVRRATSCRLRTDSQRGISIHALRTEGDHGSTAARIVPAHFYPRPPYGGRLKAPEGRPVVIIFLSTPSVRRATWWRRTMLCARLRFLSTPSVRRATEPLGQSVLPKPISIHALRTEGDMWNAPD